MQFLDDLFGKFFSWVGKHAWLAAFLFCALCFAAVSVFSVPILQNDDMQLQYLLVGGGESGSVFSIYTNVLLAGVLRVLADAWPSVCWYLVCLTVIVFAALWVLTGCVFERFACVQRELPQSRFFVWSRVCLVLFMGYYVYESFAKVQFTQGGILAALAALWMVFSAACGRGRDLAGRGVCLWWRFSTGCLLWCVGLALRWDVCLTGAFFAAGFGLALFWHKEYRRGWRVYMLAVGGLVVCAAGLKWLQADVYEGDAEWYLAERGRWVQTAVQDYPDGREQEKGALYEDLGLYPEDVAAYKAFTYVPAMENGELQKDVLRVHQSGRPGLFGWECSSKLGIPPFTGERVRELVLHPMMWTVWVPFVCLLALFLSGSRGGQGRVVWPVVVCFVGYVVILFVVNRPVERVMNPAIMVCAFVVGAWLPVWGSKGVFGRKGMVVLWGVVCAASVLFVFRHYPGIVEGALRGGQDRLKAMKFCRDHPDTLFLSLTQQGGLGLFPEGYGGFSLDYVRRTNVVPIGDGWMFYTPAYHRDLQRRGVEDPYRAFLSRGKVMLVTRGSSRDVPQYVMDMVRRSCGFSVSVRRVCTIEPFVFWVFEGLSEGDFPADSVPLGG